MDAYSKYGIPMNFYEGDINEVLQNLNSVSVKYPNANIVAGEIFYKHFLQSNITFAKKMQLFFDNNIITKEYYDNSKLYTTVDFSYDFATGFEYFSLKTLWTKYLLNFNGVYETPNEMFFRVAVSLFQADYEECYLQLKERKYIHATPTLFNIGTPENQLASCFVMNHGLQKDIIKTIKTASDITSKGGGLGLALHSVPGVSDKTPGIIKTLKVLNSIQQYFNPIGKRNGSINICLEIWHVDVESFIDIRKGVGNDEMRTRDIFHSLWICDLFMDYVRDDKMWVLLDPLKNPGLENIWGDDFNEQYLLYVGKGGNKEIKARSLWEKILHVIIETGGPSILFKDTCNRLSNQKNLGTIKSSNLCMEIMQHTSETDIATCVLGSIALPKFVDPKTNLFNFNDFKKTIRCVVRALNKVIDVTTFPDPISAKSSLTHRPIGVGVQGLADIFFMMNIGFCSPMAMALNKEIFRTLYETALDESSNLAVKDGCYDSYDSHKKGEKYKGSDISRGIFSPMYFDVENIPDALKEKVERTKVRNSLLIALMPTASTSQILGNTESFEPLTSNLYSRKTDSGNFLVINKYLIKHLSKTGHWNQEMGNYLIKNGGSISQHPLLSVETKEVFKTVWEINPKDIMRMCVDRAPFIDQSQSMNIHLDKPELATLSMLLRGAHARGLKTGLYYLRSKSTLETIKYSLECGDSCSA